MGLAFGVKEQKLGVRGRTLPSWGLGLDFRRRAKSEGILGGDISLDILKVEDETKGQPKVLGEQSSGRGRVHVASGGFMTSWR